MSEASPLVLVSNRGPVTFQEDGSAKRGTGGLVTALIGLASHRDAIWIASAMTEADLEVSDRHDGKPFEVDHKCDITLCQRPDHLQLLTKGDNVRRRGPTRRKGGQPRGRRRLASRKTCGRSGTRARRSAARQ